jgi:hypothetical protein
MKYQLYSLGVSTLAPFTRSYVEQKEGRGLIDLLVSQNGVSILASEWSLDVLNTYCGEHFNGVLNRLASYQYGSVSVTQVRCDSEATK